MNDDITLCKLLIKSVVNERIYFTVGSIEIAKKDKKGNPFLLTGDFANESLQNYYDDDVLDGYCCACLEDLDDLKNTFGTNDLDELRDSLESATVGVAYEMDPKSKKLRPSNYEVEVEYVNEESQNSAEKKAPQITNLSLGEIIKEVNKFVICQEKAIRQVTTTIYGNMKAFTSSVLTDEQKFQSKKNILLIGETGTGKTEIIRQLAKVINLPYTIVDANEYTIAGYHGKDVDNILLNIILSANNNIELAQRGIVIIDEVDKLGSNSDTHSIATDGVQKALLKMLEGAVMDVNTGYYSSTQFDTSKLTFIGIGAFSEMFSNRLKESKAIGFGGDRELLKLNKVTPNELVKFGMMPEFIGRLSVLVEMNKLDAVSLKKIVLESEISQLKIIKNFYKGLGVNLVITDDFIDNLVNEALKLNIGVRGIKTILTDVLEEVETEILNGEIKKVILEKDNIVRTRKKESTKTIDKN